MFSASRRGFKSPSSHYREHDVRRSECLHTLLGVKPTIRLHSSGAALLLALATACGDTDLTGSDPACDPAAQVAAATFNIRFGPVDPGSHLDPMGWDNAESPRRDKVIDLVRTIDADVVGVQEALENQVDDLTAALTEYSFVGVGRADGDRAGEFAGIFYRSSRFSEMDSGHFWLSATPEVPGTVFEGSAAIRMATWVRLRDQVAERDLVFLNTHWDHVSQSSRERSAALIRERLGALADDAAIIAVGDLNIPPTDPALTTLLAEEPRESPQLIDGYRQANPVIVPDEGTLHFFTGITNFLRIDYILHDDALETVRSEIERTSYDGQYPSDHFPVKSRLRWTRDRDGAACPTPLS